jgi:hypothetical protein
MSLTSSLVCKAVKDRIDADTGAGGLRNTTTPLVSAAYAIRGPQLPTSDPKPFILITPVSAVTDVAFSNSVYGFDVTFQTAVIAFSDPGLTALCLVQARLFAQLHRWAPTISGYTASQIIHLSGSIEDPQEETLNAIDVWQIRIGNT